MISGVALLLWSVAALLGIAATGCCGQSTEFSVQKS